MSYSYDNFSGITQRMVEEDGKLHIHRSNDVKSLLDDNKRLSSIAPSMHGDAKFRLAGRIDAVTAEQWSRECGAAIGTQEFALYCKRKLMDGEFDYFRVKGF